MSGSRKTRMRGKLSLSLYFQEFKDGDKVAIIGEASQEPKFPIRIKGKTGIISGKKGRAYLVKAMDGNEEKTYIMLPSHLKRLQ